MPPTDRAPLTAAVGQFAAGTDVTENLRRIEELARSAAAAGAELVVFPEASMYAWDAPAEELATAARDHGKRFLDGVRDIAARARVSLLAGGYADSDGDLPYNRLVVVTPDGRVAGSYDKVHLYDAFAWRESGKVTPAETHPDLSELCTVPVGDFTLGLLNCYDLRFPEMARALVDRGADVLVVSAAWVAGPRKELHWEVLLRARAIENTCYVLAACQPPPRSVGMSMIIDPLGAVAASCVAHEGVALHRLDPGHLADVRDILPALRHRRYRVTAAAASTGDQPLASSGETP